MLTLIYWAACVAGCYFLAKSQGRDTTTAAVLGYYLRYLLLSATLLQGIKKLTT